MECRETLVDLLSWSLLVGALLLLPHQSRTPTRYGRYSRYARPGLPAGARCPARLAWFLQELPSFLVPLLLLLCTNSRPGLGRGLLLGTFCLHYFHRTFVFSLRTRGRPCPLPIVLSAATFCSLNGFLQGHQLLHCTRYQTLEAPDRVLQARLAAGLLLFFVGMAINIHSDSILRNLRKPGESVYRIPQGGMFELVSGANFLGEILEWTGFAVASWSLPSASFAFFTLCSIGPRAYHHHRNYQQTFKDYPGSRKALVPFLL